MFWQVVISGLYCIIAACRTEEEMEIEPVCVCVCVVGGGGVACVGMCVDVCVHVCYVYNQMTDNQSQGKHTHTGNK